MVLRMSDPLGALSALQRSLDASRSSDWFGATTSGYGASPPVNVFQSGDDFILIAELPGVDKKDLDVRVKGGEVQLSGKKSIDRAEDASIHRRERVSGDFNRTLTLRADIDSERVEAELKDGVLKVFLPRAERAKARSVKIG